MIVSTSLVTNFVFLFFLYHRWIPDSGVIVCRFWRLLLHQRGRATRPWSALRCPELPTITPPSRPPHPHRRTLPDVISTPPRSHLRPGPRVGPATSTQQRTTRLPSGSFSAIPATPSDRLRWDSHRPATASQTRTTIPWSMTWMIPRPCWTSFFSLSWSRSRHRPPFRSTKRLLPPPGVFRDVRIDTIRTPGRGPCSEVSDVELVNSFTALYHSGHFCYLMENNDRGSCIDVLYYVIIIVYNLYFFCKLYVYNMYSILGIVIMYFSCSCHYVPFYLS